VQQSNVLSANLASALVVAALLGGAAPADKPWHFQHPMVLTWTIPPGDAETTRRQFWMLPAGFCWCDNRPVLGVATGIKVDPKYELWTESRDGEWRLVKTLDGVNFGGEPLALDSDVGVLAHVGDDKRGAYGSAIQFFRVPLGGGEVLSREIHPAPPRNVRVTVSGVSVWKGAIHVFLLREWGQDRNEILLARSNDNGKTWAEPVKVADTTMHEDHSRLPVLQWSADGFGRFLFESGGRTSFLFTEDGGKAWTKAPVTLADDQDEGAARIPLSAARVGKELVVAYLAYDRKRGRSGSYYLTRSADRKTWSKGALIAEQPVVGDTSTFATLAVAGGRMAFTYVAVYGDRIKGEMEGRMLLSEEGGKRWTRVPLEKYYHGVGFFSALTGAPSGDRLLYSTVIVGNPKTETTNYLVVQEYSPKPPPPRTLSAEQTVQVRALIEQLGDKSFSVREAATRKLAVFGLAAKDEMLAARKRTDDPEVQGRLDRVIERLFPAPLR
jgi:hypothetical protein